MIYIIKKRASFFLSILMAGLMGVIGSYVHTNYSKDDSLLISTAHADATPWTSTTGYVSSLAEGCGGCSGDSGY